MSFAKDNILQGGGTEPLKAIHREVVRLIEKKDFTGVADLMRDLCSEMRDLCSEDAEVNRLKMTLYGFCRTILVVTKSFENHPELEIPRKELLAFMNKKLEK